MREKLRPRDCMTAARMLSFLIALSACTSPPVADADPAPGLEMDGCRYQAPLWDAYFEAGSTKPANVASTTSRLDEVAKSWSEDRGTILLEGHIDGAEADTRHHGLDEQRAKWIQERLIERGVPPASIWIRTMSDRAPLVISSRAEIDNRRVVIRNAQHEWTQGYACLKRRRSRKLDWFARNCFPTARRPAEECLSVLRAAKSDI